jgi:hypothetical protein
MHVVGRPGLPNVADTLPVTAAVIHKKIDLRAMDTPASHVRTIPAPFMPCAVHATGCKNQGAGDEFPGQPVHFKK